MKLDKNMMDLVYRSTHAANIMGITSISIEENEVGKMVRGFSVDYGSPIVICHSLSDTLPFKAFAIHECKSFVTKMRLADNRDTAFEPSVSINDNTLVVTDIEFKGKGFKLKFNAGKPDTVKAPKGIKDTIVGSFSMNKEDITTLTESISAMDGEYVTLVYDGATLNIEVIGASAKDVFTCELSSTITSTTGSAVPAFAHGYLFKALLPALKASTGEFNMTARGLLNCSIKDINVYIFPRKA